MGQLLLMSEGRVAESGSPVELLLDSASRLSGLVGTGPACTAASRCDRTSAKCSSGRRRGCQDIAGAPYYSFYSTSAICSAVWATCCYAQIRSKQLGPLPSTKKNPFLHHIQSM